MEAVPTSKLIALHLNALYSVRKRFIEIEADEKLCWVGRYQVFYKRSDSGYWKGSGTVVGHDNKHVFLRHRGIYVCVGPCHLQLVKESEKAENFGTNEVEPDF